MNRTRRIIASLVAIAACGSPTTRDGGTDASHPRAPSIWLSTNDDTYASGALAAIERSSLQASTELAPLSGDAVLAWHGDTLVAMNFGASGQDNVSFIDVSVDPPLVRGQIASRLDGETGDANARGYLALGPTEAYIARLDQPRLLRVDRTTLTARAGPDLAPLSAGARLPNPRAMALVNDRAWVALERLSADLSHPTNLAGIAVIDPSNDHVERVIELPHANPVGRFAVGRSRVYLACVGAYASVTDGALDAVDRDTQAVSTIATEETLGANVDSVALLDENRLVLRLVSQAVGQSLAIDETKIVVYSLTDQHIVTLLAVAHFRLTEPLVASDGRVYIGDRGDPTLGRVPGVRVFDPSTGGELTSEPVSVGSLPYDLIDGR